MKKHLALLATLILTVAFLFGCGGKRKPENTRPVKEDQIDKNYGIPTLVNEVAEPAESDDPLTLSGVENVKRIAYRLMHTENYTVDGRGTVKTKVAFISYSQDVRIYKDYCRGILLEVDITESSLKNDAWQTCYVGDTAMLRGPAGKKQTWDGGDTGWEGNDPEIFTREEYREEYGLFGFELSNYNLNDGTIPSWSDVTDNGDGTYTQTVFPDLAAATGDCVRRMRKMGGLDKDPVFKAAKLTFTFDRDWRVLSMVIEETYSIKLGIITSDNCKASTVYTYTYGNADVSDFDSYFAWFLGE